MRDSPARRSRSATARCGITSPSGPLTAGLTACGENRVQELLEKNAQGAYEGAELHFIGTLQRNKVKYLVGLVELIHSVDSVELMREIDRQARKRGLVQDILLEVNAAGEASKSGFAPEALPEMLVTVDGMAIPWSELQALKA